MNVLFSRRLSRLLILKALLRRFQKAFARGVLASAQKININVYTKTLHSVFDAAHCEMAYIPVSF